MAIRLYVYLIYLVKYAVSPWLIFSKDFLSAEVGLKCLILIIILITHISLVLFILGIRQACQHLSDWLHLGSPAG